MTKTPNVEPESSTVRFDFYLMSGIKVYSRALAQDSDMTLSFLKIEMHTTLFESGWLTPSQGITVVDTDALEVSGKRKIAKTVKKKILKTKH